MDGTSLTPEQEKLNALRQILPEAFSEGKIDWEKLKATLGEDINFANERYVLNWAGKSDAFKVLQTPSTKTLVPAIAESVNFDNTENIFIEGENLEVLKVLQKSYFGKVKMIYIDPPYNTGNDSFIYPDKFSETKADYEKRVGDKDEEGYLTKDGLRKNSKENGQYHSNWLNMMMPRLYLAKNLLKQDGVIFVSIDDNEVHNLRLLMNEIFGEENFVGQITVVNNPRGRDYGGIAQMHEYLMVFTKSSESVLNDLSNPNKEFPFDDAGGGFELRELRNRNIAFNKENRPNLYYPFYINTNKELDNGLFEISLIKVEGFVELYPKESQGFKTVWRWGKEKSKENLNIEIAAKQMNDGGYMIVEKYRKSSRMARSVWADKEDNSEKGTLLVKNLFQGKKYFDFPKSMEMVSKIIEIGSNPNDLILDFFAGSGTTAHAVMELNAADGGNRKYICVQLPELCDEKSEAYKAGYKTIAEISKERIRRAGKKIQAENELKIKNYELAITKLKTEFQTEETINEIKNQQSKIEQLSAPSRHCEERGNPRRAGVGIDLGFKVLKQRRKSPCRTNEIVC